ALRGALQRAEASLQRTKGADGSPQGDQLWDELCLLLMVAADAAFGEATVSRKVRGAAEEGAPAWALRATQCVRRPPWPEDQRSQAALAGLSEAALSLFQRLAQDAQCTSPAALAAAARLVQRVAGALLLTPSAPLTHIRAAASETLPATLLEAMCRVPGDKPLRRACLGAFTTALSLAPWGSQTWQLLLSSLARSPNPLAASKLLQGLAAAAALASASLLPQPKVGEFLEAVLRLTSAQALSLPHPNLVRGLFQGLAAAACLPSAAAAQAACQARLMLLSWLASGVGGYNNNNNNHNNNNNCNNNNTPSVLSMLLEPLAAASPSRQPWVPVRRDALRFARATAGALSQASSATPGACAEAQLLGTGLRTAAGAAASAAGEAEDEDEASEGLLLSLQIADLCSSSSTGPNAPHLEALELVLGSLRRVKSSQAALLCLRLALGRPKLQRALFGLLERGLASARDGGAFRELAQNEALAADVLSLLSAESTLCSIARRSASGAVAHLAAAVAVVAEANRGVAPGQLQDWLAKWLWVQLMAAGAGGSSSSINKGRGSSAEDPKALRAVLQSLGSRGQGSSVPPLMAAAAPFGANAVDARLLAALQRLCSAASPGGPVRALGSEAAAFQDALGEVRARLELVRAISAA
ncbi:unnamed protein product, partial [Polarella glacialis]